LLDSAAFIGTGVAVARGAAQHPPATASGDLAELLDIDMDHVPAAGRFHAADDAPGRTVQPTQFGQPVAGQDAVHRRGVQPQQIADSRGSPPAQHSDFDDAALSTSRGASWRAARPRRPIHHPRLPIEAVAQPSGRPWSVTPGTSRRLVAAATDHQRHNAPAADGRFLTGGITVGHEDLRW
jgi:hypothetical protein